MMNVYEPDSRMIEIEDDRERHVERPSSAIARRMVRETELFLSYALEAGLGWKMAPHPALSPEYRGEGTYAKIQEWAVAAR